VLEDLVEVDCIILDLEERDYITSAAAYEKLKQKCSHNREAFMYVQERVHDAGISERARNTMREIIASIRMQIYVKQLLGIW
jgi:hypothetical protein